MRLALPSASVIRDALGRAAFLQALPAPTLGALADNAIRRTYAAGAPIIQQAQHGHCLFVLVRGAVRVTARAGDGRDIEIAALDTPGDFFGEMAVMGFTLRRETAVATEPTVVVEIDKAMIERVDKEGRALGGPAVKATLEDLARERAARVFFSQHLFLAKLDPAAQAVLAESANVRMFTRGDDVLEAGEPAEDVLIIKSGLARLWRMRNGQQSVVGYFNPGDVFIPTDLMPDGVGSGSVWPGTLTAMLHLEALHIDRDAFVQLPPEQREHFARASRDFQRRADLQREVQVSQGPASTILSALEDFEEAGALEARSLLTINLDVCIRCGNCVRSCQARHGHAKFVRTGKTIKRRVDVNVAGVHETILLPASCQHCASPDCMVDCPTGAIHRKSTGEVTINPQTCIGCGNCARGCPWDNITMVASPKRTVDVRELLTNRISAMGVQTGAYEDVDFRRIASKCDLCEGYSTFNCVNNCPTGAILRVDPATYYDELKQFVSRGAEGVGGGRTVQKKTRDTARIVAWSLTALLLAGVVALGVLAGFRPETPAGRILGMTALFAMVGATLLAGRRRLNRLGRLREKPAPGEPSPPIGAFRRFLDRQLGSFKSWTRFHMVLGVVGVTAAFVHAGGRFGAPLTAALLTLTGLEAVTGIMGAWLHTWLPKRISRLEGESLLEDELTSEAADLRKRRADLLADGSDALRSADATLAGASGGLFGRLFGAWSPDAAREAALARVEQAALPADDRPTLRTLVTDRLRLRDIAACQYCYTLRRGWLVTHIGITVALLVFAFAHVWAVRWLWGGLT